MESTIERLKRIRRQSTGLWLVFGVVTFGSVAGNMAQAPNDWLARVISGTAAATLFVMVEILVHVQVDDQANGLHRRVRHLVAAVAVLSFAVSYHHLQLLAAEHGQGVASYAFPIFLDVVAIACTTYLVHLAEWRRKLTNGSARGVVAMPNAEQRPAGLRTPRPPARVVTPNGSAPNAAPELAAPVRTEPAPEPQPEPVAPVAAEREARTEQEAVPVPEPLEPKREDPNSGPERLIAEFGTDPKDWPWPTELGKRFGCSKSTAYEYRAKARQLVAAQRERV
jgi:hypothetical protein